MTDAFHMIEGLKPYLPPWAIGAIGVIIALMWLVSSGFNMFAGKRDQRRLQLWKAVAELKEKLDPTDYELAKRDILRLPIAQPEAGTSGVTALPQLTDLRAPRVVVILRSAVFAVILAGFGVGTTGLVSGYLWDVGFVGAVIALFTLMVTVAYLAAAIHFAAKAVWAATGWNWTAEVMQAPARWAHILTATTR